LMKSAVGSKGINMRLSGAVLSSPSVLLEVANCFAKKGAWCPPALDRGSYGFLTEANTRPSAPWGCEHGHLLGKQEGL